MEMDVVQRTVLRHFTIRTTSAPGEKWHHRGVAFTPKKGGRIALYRRTTPLGWSITPISIGRANPPIRTGWCIPPRGGWPGEIDGNSGMLPNGVTNWNG